MDALDLSIKTRLRVTVSFLQHHGEQLYLSIENSDLRAHARDTVE